MIRYDNAPIPGVSVTFSDGQTTATGQNGWFLIPPGASVTAVFKEHWVFMRHSQDRETVWVGSYAKEVTFQRAGVDVIAVATAAGALPTGGLAGIVGVILDTFVDVEIGVSAIQDRDDLAAGLTCDGAEQWMTGWTRGYVRASLGIGLPLVDLIPDVAAGEGYMIAKHRNHDPGVRWDANATVLGADLAFGLISDRLWSTQSRHSGSLIVETELSLSQLNSIASITGVSAGASIDLGVQEYRQLGDTAAPRSSSAWTLQCVHMPVRHLGADIVLSRILRLTRAATGTQENPWPVE